MSILENNSNAKAPVERNYEEIPAEAVAESQRYPRILRIIPNRLAKAAAIVSIFLGAAALAGWWLGLEVLQSIWPGRPRMIPDTALMFVLLGGALWLVLPEPARFRFKARFRAGQVLALLAAALASAALAQAMFGGRPGIGLRLIDVGQPSFPTALSALGLGLGIALLEVQLREVWWSEVLAVITILMALLGVTGHVFGVPELYGSLHYRPDSGMAVPAATGFLILGTGLLCARAERGLMALLRSHTPGSTLARRWVMTPAAVLLVMGTVYLALQRASGLAPAVGTWALLMTSLTFLTVAVWATAQVLHRAGLEQEQAQHTLEQRVLQRTAELNQANLALNTAKEDLARANQDLEKTIEERTVHLNETIRSLETVCYNIAHDLRAPNRAIAGFAQALLAEHSGSLDQTARDCLQRMSAAAQRSDALTLDLLAYGRLGHADLPCSPQSLDDHFRAATEKLSDGIAAAHAVVELVGPLPEVLANPIALEQVLSNLLTNALKFVAPGTRPHVTVRAEDAGAYCRVLVQDNGIGIAAEHQQKIFGVFQRLHSPDEYPGSGIGLAIVQKSIQRMGGRVGVNSASGKGSCFWFELLRSSGPSR